MPNRAQNNTKLFTMFFMVVMVIPLLTIITLLASQQFIRHQMLKELESKSLATIILKKRDFKWIKQGREIEVDGKMFDVKNVTILHEDYVFKGLFDEKEEALIQTIKATQQSSGKDPLQNKVSKLLSVVFFLENKSTLKYNVAAIETYSFHLSNTSPFKSFSPALTGPPPKA